MAYQQGQIAVISFFAALFTFALCEYLLMFLNFSSDYTLYFHWIHIINYKILCLLAKKTYKGLSYEVSVRAFFLGFTFSSGILLYVNAIQSWKVFGAYVAILSTFHLTEFLAIAFTNPTVLSSDTFVINHSTAYTLAAVASWIEYFIERHFFPEIKENLWIPLIGFVLCATGEIFRKTAIFTAKQNFNHVVQNKKANDHTLVTYGIYNICRHPSYVGWFYWSIGTQLILQNPLCFLLYTVTSWKFFNDRILVEELNLIKFFGSSYIKYQTEVNTGLPFIAGYKGYSFE